MSHSLLLMSGGWSRALQLIAALSLLIILHEGGHFFFARLFKTRVEKFYLFFDFLFPFPNVLNFSLFKKKKNGTEYGIGWFPLGGYVKIAGMVDESMDKEALAKPPEPWEYRSKPAWQRLFIMLGGIIVNVLTAIIIYVGMMAFWGEDYLPSANVKYGIMVDPAAEKLIGLRNGDILVGVDGRPEERFHKITLTLLLDEPHSLEILRNGKQMSLPLPKNGLISGILKAQRDFISARVPTVVMEVEKKSEAEKMGLLKDDSIIEVNGKPVRFFDEFAAELSMLRNKPVRLTIVRNGKIPGFLEGHTDTAGKLGFVRYAEDRFLTPKHIGYSFGGALQRGFQLTGQTVADYAKQFKLMFRKEVKLSENLGGIGRFSQMFNPEFDWRGFWDRVAFISLILAFMNLLPIPGLDGGYVIFLLWEIITRRKVSDRVMEVANTVGLVLLLGLMLYANGLDIFRLFKK